MPSTRQEEFLSLPFKAKLEFLYGLPARQKRDLILSAPEAERLVQSFSPETLFYTFKEIGSADSGDLLSLAMPEQIQGCSISIAGPAIVPTWIGCANGSRR